MSLRIAFDLDGVLADFESAYREIETSLFGSVSPETPPPRPENRADGEEGAEPPSRSDDSRAAARAARRRERVWREIQAIPNFWATLKPIDHTILPRLQDLALRHRWEIFFVTQRPDCAGESVQRQTQRWLLQQGYDLPSVLVLKGSRGKVAAALHLDLLVDDSALNCVDVISESNTKAILVLRYESESDARPRRARELGVGVVPSIAVCLDFLEEAEQARSNPTLFEKVARMVGIKMLRQV